MLKASPNDGRMLLERPLSEALRLYALQLTGIGAIALAFMALFLLTLFVEHVVLPAQSAAHGTQLGVPTVVIIAVVVSLASAALGGFVATGVTRRRAEPVSTEQTIERPLSEAAHHLSAAFDAYNSETYEDAVRHGLASLHRFQEMGDIAGLADADRVLGWAHLQLDHFAQAESHALSSLGHFEAVQDEQGTAYALTLLGDIALAQDKFAEAEKYYQQASMHMEWSRDFWQIIVTSLNRANAMDGLGRSSDAMRLRTWARHLIEKPATIPEVPRTQAHLVARPALSMRHAL